MILLGILPYISLAAAFSFDGCGTSKSCWYHPPECTLHNQEACLSGVEWITHPSGIHFELYGKVNDMAASESHYLSLGFSFNQKMDDDTVIECIRSPQGDGRVQLSFNDNKNNRVLHQASTVMLPNTMITFSDGLLKCSGVFLFEKQQVDITEQWMIHDMQEKPFYLLFARGEADVYSWNKKIHSTNDGSLFPWISEETVSFCTPESVNCTEVPPTTFQWIRLAKQTDLERFWRYRVAVLHGVFMLLAWWVLGSSAILIARCFKPLFPKKKLLGTAVWFQLHRDFNVISLVLQIFAVLGIFWQAGWVWYECSYECSNDDFALKMHAITGVSATVLAGLQPFLALLRPAPDASSRPIFSWAHCIIGIAAWTLASTTFVLSLPLGKTGLNRTWGHVPNYIMGGYIITFIVTNLLLEMISNCRNHRIGAAVSVPILHGPFKEFTRDQPKQTSARLIIFGMHFLISLGVAIAITVMLVHTLLSHSV